jgi:hypothetical protein
MGTTSESTGPSGTYRAKRLVARTSLLALGVAFELAAKYDPEIQEELAEWPDGLVFAMGVLPNGPYISVQKLEGDRVRYLGLDMKSPAVSILFKNLDSALLSFTGQIGTHVAAAQHRFILRGNVAEGMKIARVMNMVQAYLFPALLLRKIFKRVPKLTPAQRWIKAKILVALVPGLLLNMAK